MTTAISIQNVSKAYRLGVIGHGTLREDLQSWWARVRGKEDPNRIIGSKEAIEGDTLWALRDVSFDVEQGSVWGIIGANGAGKSTLLKILSRVTAPTSGQIKVRGRVASLLEVGTGFHPELTGRENIFLNGAILGMTKAEVRKKFDEIVAFSEIEKFIDTPVKRYSSGMYVRLAFAVAAHLDPEILVVDEVLAVGDAAFQKKCLGKMGAVAKEGRTVLFVSHNMGAVRGLTHKAVLLEHGRVLMMGDKNEVIQRYLQGSQLENSQHLDVSNRPRRKNMGITCRLTEVTINGGREVQHGEPFSIDFKIQSDVELRDVAFGVGVGAFGGGRLLSWDCETTGNSVSVAKGVTTWRMSVPELELQPSWYTLDMAVRSCDGNHYYDSLSGECQLHVLPGPKTPSVLVRSDGQMRPKAEWRATNEKTGLQ